MELALKKLPADYKVTVNWKPFFLNPQAPTPGVDKMEHYYQKFGKERVDKMIPYMKEQGSKVGIKFSYKGKVGNTMDSHRLLYFARDNGKQDEMIEKLMSYYFEQEKDISDSKVLEAAASEIGLKDAKEFLATDKLKDEVVADVDEVRQMGISGVPAFIINGEELLSGAQETKTWVDILIERGYIQKK
mmetsp:Transcript_23181/g.37233  ORF Transcript_23181/g.37233 Transcript_23181/m.37233 type:complete len:188 (-) Transcript_23181:373-936(-)